MYETRYSIRPGTIADADSIIANNIAMARETEHRELDDRVIGPGVRAALARPELAASYWVVEDREGGGIVGQTMTTHEWSDWRNGWFWWVQSVYVSADHRRRGIFAAIWTAIRKAAEVQGDVIGIRLYVENDNRTARATYEHLGMTATDYALYEIDWSAADAAHRGNESR